MKENRPKKADDGTPTKETEEVEIPESIAARTMDYFINILTTRVATAWSRMGVFLEMIYSFGVFSPS